MLHLAFRTNNTIADSPVKMNQIIDMKIRLPAGVSILFLFALAVSGCSYTLSYSVKTTLHGTGGAGKIEASRAGEPFAEDPRAEARPKRYAVEPMRGEGEYGNSMEKKLLNILAQSLQDLGWSPVSETADSWDPFYTFYVDFDQPEQGVYPSGEFRASMGVGTGFSFGAEWEGGGGYVYDLRFLRIYALPPGALPPGASPSEGRPEYVWSSEILSDTTAGNIFELARHAMPIALERFPEPGFRKLREKVVPRRSASRPGR
jgi:hypothetical protein